jgi:hypothetical protein
VVYVVFALYSRIHNLFTFPKFGAKISTQFRDIKICMLKQLVNFVAILSIAYLKIAYLSVAYLCN